MNKILTELTASGNHIIIKKKKMCKSKIMNFLFRSDVERQKKNLDDGLIVHADLTKNRQSLLR